MLIHTLNWQDKPDKTDQTDQTYRTDQADQTDQTDQCRHIHSLCIFLQEDLHYKS